MTFEKQTYVAPACSVVTFEVEEDVNKISKERASLARTLNRKTFSRKTRPSELISWTEFGLALLLEQ